MTEHSVSKTKTMLTVRNIKMNVNERWMMDVKKNVDELCGDENVRDKVDQFIHYCINFVMMKK